MARAVHKDPIEHSGNLTSENMQDIMRCTEDELRQLKTATKDAMKERDLLGRIGRTTNMLDPDGRRQKRMWAYVAGLRPLFHDMLSGSRWGQRTPAWFEFRIQQVKKRIVQNHNAVRRAVPGQSTAEQRIGVTRRNSVAESGPETIKIESEDEDEQHEELGAQAQAEDIDRPRKKAKHGVAKATESEDETPHIPARTAASNDIESTNIPLGSKIAELIEQAVRKRVAGEKEKWMQELRESLRAEVKAEVEAELMADITSRLG